MITYNRINKHYEVIDYFRNSGRKRTYSSDCFSRIDMGVYYGKFVV